MPPYMAPFDARPHDQKQVRESPPVPPYMAPDVGSKPKLEGGVTPLYMAPPPADAK